MEFTLKLVKLQTYSSVGQTFKIIKEKKKKEEQSVVTLTLQQKSANQCTIKIPAPGVLEITG